MNYGAGSTEVGVLYEARFPDKYGNICICYVLCPDCMSNYFKYSNKINLHNQEKQFELVLEKKWVTTNLYFFVYTSKVDISLVDYWKIYQTRHIFSGSDTTVTQLVDIKVL